MHLLLTFLLITGLMQQLKHARVADAYREKEETVKSYFSKNHLNDAAFELFLRAFKKEKKLEVWVKEKDKTTYTLLRSYDFCTTSGVLGPKRKEGDLQIPEGIYHINHFNPQSNFHLSLGINYPNASDRVLSDKQRPGSAIYIHGNCATIGCIPITDDKIKELYVLAVEAKNQGQRKIPVHIFPTLLNEEGMRYLENLPAADNIMTFWKNLQPVYLHFEMHKQLKNVQVNSLGEYY
jgi:murein L,D-transpeptidase YafK